MREKEREREGGEKKRINKVMKGRFINEISKEEHTSSLDEKIYTRKCKNGIKSPCVSRKSEGVKEREREISAS